VEQEYIELARMIERLHRRFLDVIRAELNRLGIKDINTVQALLLSNIGDGEIVMRDLIDRAIIRVPTFPITSRNWSRRAMWSNPARPMTNVRCI